MATETNEEVKPAGRDRPAAAKARRAWQPNLTETERAILKLLEKGPALHSDMVQIYGDKTVARVFMVLLSQPIQWKDSNCQVQKTERNGVVGYHLVYLSFPEDDPNDFAPSLSPASQTDVQSKVDREPIDPLDIDWSKNDATISRKLGCTRERIRQLRLEYYLWSHINWDDTDEEIAKQMGILLANALGKKKSIRGCHPNRVSIFRGRKDWLKKNQNNFCRSDDFHIHNTDARQVLEHLATETLTWAEIVKAVGRNKEWVKATMAELGKSPKPKQYASRWNWGKVKPKDWATLTANQIRELVTDDQGEHPSEQVVISQRLRLRKSGKID